MNFIANNNATNFMAKLQLKTICRYDEMCDEIVYSMNKVRLYFYEKSSQQWLKDNLEGPLFIYKTKDERKYSLIFLNNNLMIDMKSYRIDNLSEIVLDLEDCFMKLDRGGEFSLAFHLETSQQAVQCHTTLFSVTNVCKGLNKDICKSTFPVSGNSTRFNASYSNAKKLSHFQNNQSRYIKYQNNIQYPNSQKSQSNINDNCWRKTKPQV